MDRAHAAARGEAQRAVLGEAVGDPAERAPVGEAHAQAPAGVLESELAGAANHDVLSVTGALFDSANSAGSHGMVLQSTGTGCA